MSDAQYQSALNFYGQGRHAEGIQALAAGVQGGHAPCMALLGHQLLAGRGGAPMDPPGGMRLIMGAAERGDAYACTVAASLMAAGVPGKPDWNRALDYLKRGAEGGFPLAQGQMRLLSGQTGEDWRAMRRAIDIKTWRAAPKPTSLSKAPRIQTFEGVASPQVCDWLIGRAQGMLRPAMVYNTAGGNALSTTRRNSAAELSLADVDLVVLALRERLAACAGLAVMNCDAPQVLHYKVGEAFTPHVDFFDPANPSQAMAMGAGGQRIATVLVYLNDEGLDGGETDFPTLRIRNRCKRGDALVFFNVDPAGQPDRRTLHAGLPPTEGEKWLLSQWIRDRPAPGAGDPSLIAALGGR
jgi:hypothetical protein